jgi:hypothetical protein
MPQEKGRAKGRDETRGQGRQGRVGRAGGETGGRDWRQGKAMTKIYIGLIPIHALSCSMIKKEIIV